MTLRFGQSIAIRERRVDERSRERCEGPNEIGPTRAQLIREDLLTNSIHFPLANLLFEYFYHHGVEIFIIPETYALLFGALVQASVLGSLRFHGRTWFPLANLIAPVLYIGFEYFEHGSGALTATNHQLYFCFALLVGVVQQTSARFPGVVRVLLVLEAVLRTAFILAMYSLFDAPQWLHHAGIGVFLQSDAHQFMAAAVLFLGLVLGMGNVTTRQQLQGLTLTARRLHDISAWSWGHTLVTHVVRDPTRLRRRRVQRFILFLDIRGFTAWCDRNQPEAVLGLLNQTFDALEAVWRGYPVIRAKLTGDELMLVVEPRADVLQLAEGLSRAAHEVLAPQGLGVGVGVHFGPVIEGLVGSQSTRVYDVLGDVVNVAARLCGAARKGECLMSDEALRHARVQPGLPRRAVIAKGKPEPILAHVQSSGVATEWAL